jgi:hypothetical protein
VWHDGGWGGFVSRLVLAPAHGFAVAVLVNDGAGGRVLDDVAWGALAAVSPTLAPPSRARRLATAGRAVLRAGLARIGPRR